MIITFYDPTVTFYMASPQKNKLPLPNLSDPMMLEMLQFNTNAN